MEYLLTLTGLASRDRNRQTPFESISSKNSDFVDQEYIPNGIKLSDPRSMNRDALIKFFQHISSREASHGIENAFRFKSILSSRKKGVLRAARYKENDIESDVLSVTVCRTNRKAREKLTRLADTTESAPTHTVIPPQNTESGQNNTVIPPQNADSGLNNTVIPQNTESGQNTIDTGTSGTTTRRPTKKSIAPIETTAPASNIRRSTRINTAQLQLSGPSKDGSLPSSENVTGRQKGIRISARQTSTKNTSAPVVTSTSNKKNRK